MIDIKGFSLTIVISIFIMLILIAFVYDFDVKLIYISDIFFIVGMVFFSFGLIIVTGATEIFDSIGYLTKELLNSMNLTKKYFRKDEIDRSYLKSFGEYKEYKRLNGKSRLNGLNALTVGGAYIIASIVISTIV